MKQRFSSLDLQSACSELNSAVEGTRLANVYDVNSRTFLLKFSKPGEKHSIVIESGFRIHLTEFSRETAATPSNFCTKLRKHVRTRRITTIKQLGTDRVVVLTFGGGENASDPERSYHIILEFYAGGNVILTDGYYKIISLLRVVGEDEGQKVAVNEIYDISRRVGVFQSLTKERLVSILKSAKEGKTTEEPDEDLVAANALQSKRKPAIKKKQDKQVGTLKKVLAAPLSEYGAALIEHTILKAGLVPTLPVQEFDLESPPMDALFASFEESDTIVKRCKEGRVTGFIIAKKEEDKEGNQILVYDDFQPFNPEQAVRNNKLETIAVEGYNACVDKFFSSIESQKLEGRIRQQEALADKKLQASRDEHQKKIDGLIRTQETSAQKAAALQGSQGLVDEACAAVSGLIAQGMDWVDIERLIESEQVGHNPVAKIISLPLKLETNSMTVKLQDPDDLYNDDSSSSDDSSNDSDSNLSDGTDSTQSSDEEQITDTKKTYLFIDVDIGLSAFSNARLYYDKRKEAISKGERTQQSSKKALRSTERKIQADLKKHLNQEKALMKPIRKVHWFEKFLWFISSEGYLVLGGHDAQQNEMLYRKHFRKGDVYVHADLTGAATVIVKNTDAKLPIPPSTISQAGTLTVATSRAWDAKMVISAWWVYHDQVSKTAPTGEYLTTGSFMIRGKKNFLPPAKLELGYGLLFLVDQASRDRHVKNKLQNVKEDARFAVEVNNTENQKTDKTDTKHELEDTEIELGQVQATNELKEDTKMENNELYESISSLVENEKYDLHNYGFDDEQPFGEEAKVGFSRKQSRPLTAKERREARKARVVGNIGRHDSVRELEGADPLDKESTALHSAKQTESSDKNEKAKPQQLTRAQKAKKKKQAKYADQDEEDKALAAKVLGLKLNSETTDVVEKPNENREFKPKSQPRSTNPEVAQILKDEHIEVLGDDEMENVTPLDVFVSDPLPDDVLLDVIPTCAPYTAMAKYKFRVKLQPGPSKIGKSLRGVQAQWIAQTVDETSSDREKLWPREKELIKSLKDEELFSCVGVSKIKVTSGKGETAAKNRAKKGKGKK